MSNYFYWDDPNFCKVFCEYEFGLNHFWNSWMLFSIFVTVLLYYLVILSFGVSVCFLSSFSCFDLLVLTCHFCVSLHSGSTFVSCLPVFPAMHPCLMCLLLPLSSQSVCSPVNSVLLCVCFCVPSLWVEQSSDCDNFATKAHAESVFIKQTK